MKTKLMMIGLLLAVLIGTPVLVAAPDWGGRGPNGGYGVGPGPVGPRGGQFAGGGEFDGPRGQRQGGRRGQMGPEGREEMIGMLLGRLGDKLELTEEQRTTIKGILEEAKTARKENRQALAEAMKALQEATSEGTEEAIIAAGKQVGDAFTNQSLQKASVKNKIDAVLTDEQKTELKVLKEQMQERREERMQQRQGQQDRGGFRQGQRPERRGQGQGPGFRGGFQGGEGFGPRDQRRGGPEIW